MQQIDQFKTTYFQECEELLSKLEEHLSGLARSADPKDDLNAAFRAIHSIKGGAAMFGFTRLVCFSHVFESALDAMRSGRIAVSEDLVEKALNATDVLTDLAAATKSGEALPEGYEVSAREQLETAFLDTAPKIAGTAVKKAPAIQPTPDASALKAYSIKFEPAPDMLRRAIEPLLIARNLAAMGNLEVHTDTSKLPAFADLDPAVSYLSWSFELETREPIEAVQDVFQFVSGSCKLEIEALEAPVSAPLEPVRQTQAPAKDIRFDSQRPIADRRVTSIRVDLERVERLVDLVGEITIAQAMVLQHLDQSMVDSNSSLFRALSQLLQHSRGLQDGVMAIRAQPIRSIFARMPRVAREVAQETGRVVQLEMSGEETEIDKTIIEQLSDPLIHIVRNSIDHGIEPAGERRAAGKPETGTVRLTAAQRGGRIVVEVTDDGRGIDQKAVRQRAIERNLITADAELSEDEINNLIFSPGLSTARAVSDISGRGVGMDIVFENIQKLGGRVSVRSQHGAGTTTTITLPLTLAVLDGMLVRAGAENYLIPLNNIVECIVITRQDLKSVAGSGQMITVRGRQIPTVNLVQQFGLKDSENSNRLPVVLVEMESGSVVGLIVDEICGHKQVVIKSIRQNFRDLPGIAGATILGDGNVALILDVTQLALLASARDSKSFKAKVSVAIPEIIAA
jgi:two-component system, chemotaxis family, sensor kinase CheA